MSADTLRHIVRLAMPLWLPAAKTEKMARPLDYAANRGPVHQNLYPQIEHSVVLHWRK